MTTPALDRDVARVCEFLKPRMHPEGRTLVAIAGPPASGKSTLAEAVVATFNSDVEARVPMAALLPMDGYHLDNSLLAARGLLARKGAPETFDGDGFCQAVRLLTGQQQDSYHPRFDRNLDLAVGNAIAIAAATPLVVVEGNYLLLRSEPWAALRPLFAATVFVCPPLQTLRGRLEQRWAQHGLAPGAALKRAIDNDLPNADLVLRNSFEADLHLTQNYTQEAGRFAL